MISREVARAVRGHADQQTGQIAGLPPLEPVVATVQTTSPLTVLWIDEVVPADRLVQAYPTPVVGHRVLGLLVYNQLIILGQVG
jgi:hypothetical protein